MIVRGDTKERLQVIREMFREYVEFLGVSLDFQEFESELAALPGKYAEPDGGLFLISWNDAFAGCGALRRIGEPEQMACEMKRLYIRPVARGAGLGRKLAQFLVDEGVRLGYKTMYLDTLERLVPAMKMYESMGFKRVDAYYDNPLPDVVYWAKQLTE